MGMFGSFFGTFSLITFILSIIIIVLGIKYLIRVPKALELINNTLCSMQHNQDNNQTIKVSDEL